MENSVLLTLFNSGFELERAADDTGAAAAGS